MLICILRTIVFYVALVAVLRLLGKRQIGQMEPSEFVVMMLLANLAAIPIENLDMSVWLGLVPIGLVYLAELLMSVLTLHSIRVRKLFCGKPVILIENGEIQERNLKRTRINLDELTMHLREKDIFDLSTVKFAILETNGQLSTLLYAKDQPASARDAGQKVQEVELPITVISDGKLLSTNLAKTGKDENWVNAELRKRNCTQKDTLLLTVDSAGKVYFVRKKEQN